MKNDSIVLGKYLINFTDEKFPDPKGYLKAQCVYAKCDEYENEAIRAICNPEIRDLIAGLSNYHIESLNHSIVYALERDRSYYPKELLQLTFDTTTIESEINYVIVSGFVLNECNSDFSSQSYRGNLEGEAGIIPISDFDQYTFIFTGEFDDYQYNPSKRMEVVKLLLKEVENLIYNFFEMDSIDDDLFIMNDIGVTPTGEFAILSKLIGLKICYENTIIYFPIYFTPHGTVLMNSDISIGCENPNRILSGKSIMGECGNIVFNFLTSSEFVLNDAAFFSQVSEHVKRDSYGIYLSEYKPYYFKYHLLNSAVKVKNGDFKDNLDVSDGCYQVPYVQLHDAHGLETQMIEESDIKLAVWREDCGKVYRLEVNYVKNTFDEILKTFGNYTVNIPMLIFKVPTRNHQYYMDCLERTSGEDFMCGIITIHKKYSYIGKYRKVK